MDRLNLPDFDDAGGRNMMRRDDIMSMNNMSIDMFNMLP